eukprot:549842-Amphidinium_carterae.1
MIAPVALPLLPAFRSLQKKTPTAAQNPTTTRPCANTGKMDGAHCASQVTMPAGQTPNLARQLNLQSD